MFEPILEVQGLKKSYVHEGNTLHVLKGIDLQIGKGELLAIVGKSGAGKSTLLHCMGTLDTPSYGDIVLDGHSTGKLNSSELAKLRNQTIGFVFQFHHLLPEFTALENVAMPAIIAGQSMNAIRPRAESLLETVGLKERVQHRPGELSGGEQQRVALARALCLKPKLLMADEPTGNLDTGTSEAMHKLFYQVNQEHGVTIVVVTHNLEFARQMPRIVHMRDGAVEHDEQGRESVYRLAEGVSQPG